LGIDKAFGKKSFGKQGRGPSEPPAKKEARDPLFKWNTLSEDEGVWKL
jgi:hypothetical protein